MMRPAIFLRVASGLTMLHAVLHTIGGVFGGAAAGVQQATLEVMQANRFLAMGAMRSYFDFYRGMGLVVSIFLTLEAVVFWQLGALVKTDGLRLRPLLVTFLIGYLTAAVVSFRYFFWAPVATEVLIAACLGMAIAGSERRAAREA